jgi:hypothetical protein
VALMTDNIINLNDARPLPPATPEVSEEDFLTIVNGLKSLPSHVKISAIVHASDDDERGTLAAILATLLGNKIVEHVWFGLMCSHSDSE